MLNKKRDYAKPRLRILEILSKDILGGACRSSSSIDDGSACSSFGSGCSESGKAAPYEIDRDVTRIR